MNWTRIGFENAITHVCPNALVGDLVTEMLQRGCPITDFEQTYGKERAAVFGGNPVAINTWAFDLGGMAIQDEPLVYIELSGLAIRVACAHIRGVIHELKQAELRRFASGAQYHKLKLWLHATVLTPAQRIMALDALSSMAIAAGQRYEEFCAAHARRYANKP